MNQRKDEMVRELQQRLEQEKDAHAIADRNGHAMRSVFYLYFQLFFINIFFEQHKSFLLRKNVCTAFFFAEIMIGFFYYYNGGSRD